MASDRNPFDSGTDEAEPTGTATPPGPENEDDTEGQMMLPDGTARYLARDRERDIRRHLSDRQQEQLAKEAKKRR